jgi:site-specific recombinase XerD
MLNQLFPNPEVQKRLTASSSGQLIQNYADYLQNDGYKESTMLHLIRAAAHFGYWIDTQGLTLQDVDDHVLEQFSNHLPTCCCPSSRPGQHDHTIVGAKQFLKYLSGKGVSKPLPKAPSLHQPLLDKFFQWMQLHRGVTQQTATAQCTHAASVLDALGDEPSNWDVKSIRQFVLSYMDNYKRSYSKTVGSNLRMFLRFLVTEGLCQSELIDAVPKIANWKMVDIPRHLPAESVERVIAASGGRAQCKLRDRAVILLLARLGLRARDISGLQLLDINWQQGLIRVMGKGRRETWLPLPQDAGDALLEYLVEERPPSQCQQVFLCSRAPFRPFKGISSVQHIARCALRDAAVQRPVGVVTHLFRHSLARRLLAQDIPLEGIGVILRHRNLQTSSQYAKIDFDLLKTVVQPWPKTEEVRSC